MHVEECVCVCMCPCMYMYDVLVEIGGGGGAGRREGLKASDKHEEGESTSLA